MEGCPQENLMKLVKVKNLASGWLKTGYQNILKLALALTRLFCEVFSQLNILIRGNKRRRSGRWEVNDIVVAVILIKDLDND